jgi:hypothetical protein
VPVKPLCCTINNDLIGALDRTWEHIDGPAL